MENLKVENIVAKGEISHFMQFLPSAAEASESVYMRERVNQSLVKIEKNTIHELLILVKLKEN